MNQIYLSGYLVCKCFCLEFAWIFLFLLTMCLVSMNHKFHLLNYYLLTTECTEIHIHHQTSEEWLKIQKSVLIYTWHVSQFEIIGQAQKKHQAIPCMVIMGNRGIWFGAIFPYMVMVGNRGIWFSAITGYYRCHFLLELALYCSSI